MYKTNAIFHIEVLSLGAHVLMKSNREISDVQYTFLCKSEYEQTDSLCYCVSSEYRQISNI